ncbi:MAG: DUF998 domain-containing protein [Chloroflexi bacterium]|nr:DUF998 domain-containing protein [Chloroflexota bacterium]
MTTAQPVTPVHSYLSLRWIIGGLTITLPLVLVIWEFISCECGDIGGSISGYYDSAAGDYFVGAVFAIGIFLFTYRGYAKRAEDKEWLTDDTAGNLTCIFLIGVALLPSSGDGWIGQAHLAFAALSFAMLAYFCLVLFVKSGGSLTNLKRRRNRVYRTCGAIIALCIVLIGAYLLFLQDEESISDLSPVFWLEWLALWAFGISWFVKGKALRRFKL